MSTTCNSVRHIDRTRLIDHLSQTPTDSLNFPHPLDGLWLEDPSGIPCTPFQSPVLGVTAACLATKGSVFKLSAGQWDDTTRMLIVSVMDLPSTWVFPNDPLTQCWMGPLVVLGSAVGYTYTFIFDEKLSSAQIVVSLTHPMCCCATPIHIPPCCVDLQMRLESSRSLSAPSSTAPAIWGRYNRGCCFLTPFWFKAYNLRSVFDENDLRGITPVDNLVMTRCCFSDETRTVDSPRL